MDKVTLLLVALLLATLVAFFTDVFPYPFGLLVILTMLGARVLNLRDLH